MRIETLLALLWHAPLRTVALAQGRTEGAGADLFRFAACEQRVASASTRSRFPGAQFGIVLGRRRLADRIGADAARELVSCGGELDAWKAEAAGLATVIAENPPADWSAPKSSPATARAVRAAVRTAGRDADLAALMRSAAEPGLKARIGAYRQHRQRLLDTR